MKINTAKHITKFGVVKDNPLTKKEKAIVTYAAWQVNELGDGSSNRWYFYRNTFIPEQLAKINKMNSKIKAMELFDSMTKVYDNQSYDKLAVDFISDGAGTMSFNNVTSEMAKEMATNNLKNPNHTFYNKGAPIKSLRVHRITPRRE
jgi:hypothetical protein